MPKVAKFTGGEAQLRTHLNIMVDAINRLQNISSDGLVRVQQTGSGTSYSLSLNKLLPRIPKTKKVFWAEITGNTSLGNDRWTYSFKEVEKTSAGYGGFTDVTGGKTGTDTAYNFIEDMNDGLTVEGNGVNVDNLDTDEYTFAIQPAPTGLTVKMLEIYDGVSAFEFWFQYENGIDGACD
jgi:hypothetical protein|tara:strand:- start:29 stop:568 length:540 start_codon:yes stop_codon:yes gene_type:complete